VPWVAFGQLDRHGSNLMPSPASPSVRAATPTKLRGMESLDTAVYWSLTSCHSVLAMFVRCPSCSFNLKSVKALGLTIALEVLYQAHRLIC
jgi:hypothetical protein